MFNIIGIADYRWESRYVMSRVYLLFGSLHNPPFESIQVTERTLNRWKCLHSEHRQHNFCNVCLPRASKTITQACSHSTTKHAAANYVSGHGANFRPRWVNSRYTTEVKTCNTKVKPRGFRNTGIGPREIYCFETAMFMKCSTGWNEKQSSFQHFGSPCSVQLQIAEQALAWPVQKCL